MTQQPAKQLGEILVEDEVITQDQLDAALAQQAETGNRLGAVLIELGFIEDADLARALAGQAGLEYMDLSELEVEPWLRTLIPDSVSRRYGALPVGERDGKLLVAVSDPTAAYALDDLRVMTNRDVQAVMATAEGVEQARGSSR